MKRTYFNLILLLSVLWAFSACQKETVVAYDPVKIAAEDDAIIQKYIAKDTTIHNAVKTASGLYYVKRKSGSGPLVQRNNTIKVHYIGKFLDGSVFESSYATNSPLVFKVGVGAVIKGWDEGLQLMQEGETALFFIPSGLAYGPAGNKTIPPNTVLVFDITVLDIL